MDLSGRGYQADRVIPCRQPRRRLRQRFHAGRGCTPRQPSAAHHRRISGLSTIIANHRPELAGIEASDTRMVVDSHPAMQGMKSFLHAEGLTNIAFSGNLFDGFYLPEGIILRSAL